MSPSAGAPEPPLLSVNFVRSLPLFIVAGVFFGIGVVAFVLDPHYGPGFFTLWALLIALGFVSSIGGVASWLLVPEPEAAAPLPRPARSAPPTTAAPPVGRTPAARNRGDFGRPSPDVRDRAGAPSYRPTPSDFGESTTAAPVWDEEGAHDEPPLVMGEPVELVSVEDALRDLDGIEQALVPRSRPHSNPTPST